jgi:hypothetical protein
MKFYQRRVAVQTTFLRFDVRAEVEDRETVEKPN